MIKQNPSTLIDLVELHPNLVRDLTDFTKNKVIGKGGVGEVWIGYDTKQQVEWAVKQLLSDHLTDKELVRYVREIHTMAVCKNRFIIPLAGFTVEPPFAIMLEFLENGALDDAIFNPKPGKNLSDNRMNIIALGIAHGMAHLHKKGILHRDLKPANVLLDKKFLPRLCDFGLARYEEGSLLSKNAGTPVYMAPEVYLAQPYTTKVDVFSYGIMMAEMSERKRAYTGFVSPIALCTFVAKDNGRPKLTDRTPKPLQRLIQKCWDNDPKKRPTFDEIFEQLSTGKVLFKEAEKSVIIKISNQIKEKENEEININNQRIYVNIEEVLSRLKNNNNFNQKNIKKEEEIKPKQDTSKQLTKKITEDINLKKNDQIYQSSRQPLTNNNNTPQKPLNNNSQQFVTQKTLNNNSQQFVTQNNNPQQFSSQRINQPSTFNSPSSYNQPQQQTPIFNQPQQQNDQIEPPPEMNPQFPNPIQYPQQPHPQMPIPSLPPNTPIDYNTLSNPLNPNFISHFIELSKIIDYSSYQLYLAISLRYLTKNTQPQIILTVMKSLCRLMYKDPNFVDLCISNGLFLTVPFVSAEIAIFSLDLIAAAFKQRPQYANESFFYQLIFLENYYPSEVLLLYKILIESNQQLQPSMIQFIISRAMIYSKTNVTHKYISLLYLLIKTYQNIYNQYKQIILSIFISFSLTKDINNALISYKILGNLFEESIQFNLPVILYHLQFKQLIDPICSILLRFNTLPPSLLISKKLILASKISKKASLLLLKYVDLSIETSNVFLYDLTWTSIPIPTVEEILKIIFILFKYQQMRPILSKKEEFCISLRLIFQSKNVIILSSFSSILKSIQPDNQLILFYQSRGVFHDYFNISLQINDNNVLTSIISLIDLIIRIVYIPELKLVIPRFYQCIIQREPLAAYCANLLAILSSFPETFKIMKEIGVIQLFANDNSQIGQIIKNNSLKFS